MGFSGLAVARVLVVHNPEWRESVKSLKGRVVRTFDGQRSDWRMQRNSPMPARTLQWITFAFVPCMPPLWLDGIECRVQSPFGFSFDKIRRSKPKERVHSGGRRRRRLDDGLDAYIGKLIQGKTKS